MKNILFLAGGILLLAFIGMSVFFTFRNAPREIACTEEAKICPGGSAVGRIGPRCEFALCPKIDSEYGAATAKINQTIASRGVSITPREVIEDSRCPVDVLCVWAGTVRLRLKLEREDEAHEAMITLGSSIVFAGKRISLEKVSPAPHSDMKISEETYRFDFAVTLEASAGGGIFAGRLTIGPVCPVERIDHPCTPTPEMFTARKIFVSGPDKKIRVATITPDGNGQFSLALPEGIYYVDMEHQAVGGISGLPKTISIEKGKMIWLDVAVDTGIR